MWKASLFILALSFSESVSDNTNQETTSHTGGSDTNLFSLLSGNGIYNPMDPMGFIFEGNSKQYNGNGIDVPKYNPDVFAYKYAGTAFGSAVNPFVPNFVNSETINNSPNYAHHSQLLEPTQRKANVTGAVGERNETKARGDTFSNLPVAAGSPPKATYSEFASQTFPENVMSALNISASDMFPGASFSGQPGMLGIGKQIPLQAVIPEQSPVPQRQYLPAMMRNVSETRISSPVYDGFPGMEGSKQQANIVTNNQDTKPSYNGYPGMLGVGQMYNNMGNGVHAPIDTDTGSSSSQGYSNRDHSGYRNSGVNVNENTYISAVPGVNSNNWKGEWPGKTSAGRDWSGDWTDKWPKGDTHEGDDNKGAGALQFRNSASQTSSHMDWDGSWPGSNGKDGATTKSPSDDFGNLSETMAALEKLMSMLNNIPASGDQGVTKGAPRSFSQMVSSWKDDMKP